MAKVVLDIRGATGYVLVEQGGVCAVATATYCTRIDTSGEIETQLPKFTVLSLLVWVLGTMAPKYTADIGNYPVYNNVPGALYFLKSFKCGFAAAQTKQMILRRLEVKRMTDLKTVNPSCDL